MSVKKMGLFGTKIELPYDAYKHDIINDLVHDGIDYVDFIFDNFIGSRIRVLTGYYHPKTGEPCTVIKHRCTIPKWNVDYSVCVNSKEISSFRDALKILKEIDKEIFDNF